MHLDLVNDYIWLSDLEAAADASKLDALNICHVLSVGCDVQGATNFVKSNRTIRYMALPDIRDEPEANLMRLFPQMLTFLHEASLEKGTNRNIVVHCVHGQSRSAATVVAYLSSSFSGMNMNLEDTLTFLKDRCPRICINPGFLSQMHLYYNRMHYPAEYSLDKIELKRSIWQINNGSAGAPYYAQEKTPWSAMVSNFSTQNVVVLFHVAGKKIKMEVVNPITFELVDELEF